MQKSKSTRQASTTIKLVCTVSTLVLTALLLVFLIVTIVSMSVMNDQIKLSIDHPFVVSRYMGLVRANVAQMRVRTERLQPSAESRTVVRSALDKLYEDMVEPLSESKRLYLGPEADIALLINTFNDIQTSQQALLQYASEAGRTKEEITRYEEKFLYALYDQMETSTRTILDYTQNTQTKLYTSANSLWKTTLTWSIIIVIATISGLLLFQYLIGRLNKALCTKSQQFDTLSYTIDETFMIFDRESVACEFVAENASRVLGVSVEAISRDRNLFYRYVSDEARAEVKDKLYGADASFPCEVSAQYANPETHEKRWLLARFYQMSGGAHTRYIVSLADRTQDMRARHALQDALTAAQNANNAKRDFLSRMSHEIRTPMNAIIGMTTIAAASIENRLRVENCLEKISYSSKHLLMLINDILDMSRIENNKLSINNEPFDVYQFINAFVSIIYSQVQSKEITFTEKMIGFSDKTVYIGDSLRLNQILLNLTSNAIKFTEKGGRVALEVRRIPSASGNEHIRFTVEDTGIGMNEDALKRLYDPFEQADPSISQKYGGTGLGMPITKNLVSLMGGYIDVKSQIGKGTICAVELPFEKSAAELDVLSAEKLKALNVLVVDDEEDACEHTALLLQKINIRTQWVLSGMDAVKRIEHARDAGDGFDICFIDWNMPNMNGIETTRRIRERVGPDTPIIIISAYDWSDIEQEARNAGVNAFISKPLFLSSIYNVLVNVTNGTFARSSGQAVGGALLAGRTILVAEDNELNLEIAEEMLKMNGARVESAHDGKEAADMFAASAPRHFDAILMDIQMPVMNGYEATQAIRSLGRPDAKKIPIIATTANAFSEDVSAALSAGMNDHISKPIDMKKLCEQLDKLIK